MATTNFDTMSMRLSRRLKDSVSWTAGGGAGVDGKIWTNTNRQDYLNQANKQIQAFIYFRDKSPDKSAAQVLLQSLVSSASITITSNGGDAVPSDYNNMPLYVIKGTGGNSFYQYSPTRGILDANLTYNFQNTFTVATGKLLFYSAGARVATGTATFYYIIKDEVTQNGATDIQISTIFYDWIVDLAAHYALSERPDGQALGLDAFWTRFKLFLDSLGA